MCAAVSILPLLQLVPTPPGLWTRLPDRDRIVVSFELLGRPLPWHPISMVPSSTWLGWLSLIPPVAVFLGTSLLGFVSRRRVCFVILGFGAISLLLGLFQIAEGPGSALRFYATTNLEDAVGFFANRNHFAALLYCLTVFAGAWAIDCALTARLENRWLAPSVFLVIVGFTFLVALIAAQAMARSRAGIGLSIVALSSSFALALTDIRSRADKLPVRILAATVGFSVLFAMQFALYRLMTRFSDPSEDWRLIFTRNTWAAAKSLLPFGSGIGTFVPVYALHEPARDLLPNTYANHAHNDLVQLALEGGLLGLVLPAALVLWVICRAFKLWQPGAFGLTDFDQALSRCATVIVLLLVVHSFFDYPLRTGGMMAMLAFALGLLVPPPAGADGPDAVRAAHTPAKKRGSTLRMAAAPSPQPIDQRPSVASPRSAPGGYHWPNESMPQAPEPADVRERVAKRMTQPASKQSGTMAWPNEWRELPGMNEPRRETTAERETDDAAKASARQGSPSDKKEP